MMAMVGRRMKVVVPHRFAREPFIAKGVRDFVKT